MNFFKTFRGRLLIILAFLLIATLGFQYYLNLLTQDENNSMREKQEQALVAGFALGINTITSREEYLDDLYKREGQTFFDAEINERIKDIIVINQKWQITDSLNHPEYVPVLDDNGQTKYLNLSDIKSLPPLMEGRNRLGEDFGKFPNARINNTDEMDGEAHAIPVETSDGRYYVMVILKNDKREAFARAARPRRERTNRRRQLFGRLRTNSQSVA